MPQFKKQHFLTKKYLERFAQDDYVYSFDGNRQRHVPYKDQCQKPYFYSKKQAHFVEGVFSRGESMLLDRIRSIEDFLQSEPETGITLAHVVGLYLKNPKVANDTARERFEAIDGLLVSYMLQFMTDEAPGQKRLNALFYGLTVRWRMFLLKTPEDNGQQVVTSDCPTSIATDAPSTPPCFVFIPLSDKEILFFADKARYNADDSVVDLSDAALTKLNLMTAVGSANKIYSHHPLSEEQRALYRHGIVDPQFQSKDRVFQDGQELKFEHVPMLVSQDVIAELAFLKKSNPAGKYPSYEEARRLYKSGAVTIDSESRTITVSKDMSVNELYCATVAAYM
jgi:hypothetical protein